MARNWCNSCTHDTLRFVKGLTREGELVQCGRDSNVRRRFVVSVVSPKNKNKNKKKERRERERERERERSEDLI